MPELYWPNDSMFRDAETDTEYIGEGTYDVDDDRVDEFLERGWQEADEADDSDDSDDSSGDEDDEVAELLEGTVDEVSDVIGSGAYDDQLDDVESQAERVGVEDAVADRRDELESED